jgi:hypothetical protein
MPTNAQLAAKRRNESLEKRIETLLIKAHELWDIFSIDVAVFLKYNTQYCTYRSTDNSTWPPTMAEIVGYIYFISKLQLTRDRKRYILSRETYFLEILK